MLRPKPTIKLNTCPDIVPVHAITEKPKLDKLALANKSASVLPRANKVQDNKVLLMSCVIERNLIMSTIIPAE